MRNFIRKIINKFTLQTPSILKHLKSKIEITDTASNIEIPFNKTFDKNTLEKLKLSQKSFGDLNQDKIFYFQSSVFSGKFPGKFLRDGEKFRIFSRKSWKIF